MSPGCLPEGYKQARTIVYGRLTNSLDLDGERPGVWFTDGEILVCVVISHATYRESGDGYR